MSQLQDRIAQFRKMAADDPDNELGHYRLGQLLMEAKEYGPAIESFEKTLQLSPQFSKVFHLLALCLVHEGRREQAIRILNEGYRVADERGDNMPRDEMSRMLVELGEPAPVSLKLSAPKSSVGGPGGGFACQRPGCQAGGHARPLTAAPIPDEIGERIRQTVCADCWTEWLRNYSIKVINELRLDLSTPHGQEEYDRYMREFLGME